MFGDISIKKLNTFCLKSGIDFAGNPNIGKGLIIGHWGRIVINGNAKFGNEIMITHNVTIGRDIRGKELEHRLLETRSVLEQIRA